MTEQSFVLDLTLVETFWDNWNKSGWYGADTMVKTTPNYEMVIADSSSTNPLNDISDAIENGALKSTVTLHNITGDATLYYYGASGSWERTISFPNKCVVDIGNDNLFVKAIFLRNKSTKKVVAYCIFSQRMPMTNQIVIPAESIGWRIRENVRYGE